MDVLFAALRPPSASRKESARSEAVRKSMDFRFERPSDTFDPMVRATYRCAKTGDDFLQPPTCDFSDARRILEESTKLKSMHSNELLKSVVDLIEREPMEYLPHSARGYRFERWELNLFELARVDDEPSTSDRNVWGWLDFQQVLRRESQIVERTNNQSCWRWFAHWALFKKSE
jgi:hypothetical protein